MRRCHYILAHSVPAAALLWLLVLPLSAAPDAAGTCYRNWSDAAPIVAEKRLLPARDVQEMTRRQLSGEVVRITLCFEAAGYVYRLLHRDDNGRISNFTVDAQAGHRQIPDLVRQP